MQINTLTGTETSPQKLAFSTQGTPSRPRTASSPLAYKRLKTTMTKSTFNAAMLQSPSSSIVYEHTRHNSDIASPEVMAYANQVWINENKGRRPDEKFMSFITEIRKTRKASKKNLRKTMKSLRTPDKGPADVVDAQIIAAKEELERRRKSVGLFETISANKTKKLVREKTFMQIKQKVDQMIYEDSNPGKFVKHLMNVQIDTSALMQPRFQGFDQSAPVSPSMPQSAKTDFKRLVNPTKPLKADEEEVLLQGPKTLSYLKQGNKEVYNKIDIGAVKRYVHISKRSVGSPPLIGPDGTIGVTLSQKTTEKDRERKKLMKIAQGEARGQDGEEEEELDSPQPIPEFIAQAYAMSVKKTKKVGVNDRMKAGATIDELIRKGEQSRIVADFNLRHQHPMMFSYVRELSEFNSEKGSPKMGNSPFGSPMTSATATFRKGQASVPPTQLLSSLFSARSSNITPEMKNGGDLTRKGTTTRAGPEEKPLEIVPLKLAKHKRTDRKELDEREKYHVKVDTYVSPRAVKKSIDTFAQTFYKEKAMDNPKSQLELYNEFKRLTTTCAKNVKSSKRIKRVMRKTFGNLNKNFGKIDMMIEERDVEFERQIKKDIKEDMKSYIPSAALLKMHPSVNV